jgi:NADPH:quinone reductase-like Zn-dependent oxidoreductase
MKAIVHDEYGSADVLRLEDVEAPTAADGQVLLRVGAASAFIGDRHLMTGTPYAIRLVSGLRRPKQRVRGQDVAGTVEALGPGVTALEVGDEVFGVGLGTFAEYAVARVDRIAPKPSNLTFEEAATVPTTGCTALQGIRDVGTVKAGDRVLVIGAAGGVGSFAVQIAKTLGAHVTGVTGTSTIELARSIGADDVIDYTRGRSSTGRAASTSSSTPPGTGRRRTSVGPSRRRERWSWPAAKVAASGSGWVVSCARSCSRRSSGRR